MKRRLDEKKNTCWDGYSPGAKTGKKTKKSPKTGKIVNNCEKISELDEEAEMTLSADNEDRTVSIKEVALRNIIRRMVEACYQGKKVKLDSPSSSDNPKKKSKVYVSSGEKIKSDGACKGHVRAKKVEFGDPNMRIKKSNPKNRANFRARHNCDEKKPKDSAGYWSCKAW